MIMPVA